MASGTAEHLTAASRDSGKTAVTKNPKKVQEKPNTIPLFGRIAKVNLKQLLQNTERITKPEKIVCRQKISIRAIYISSIYLQQVLKPSSKRRLLDYQKGRHQRFQSPQ